MSTRFLIGVTFLLPALCFGQIKLSGSVVDSEGNVISFAKLKLQHQTTQSIQYTHGNADGLFYFDSLEAGGYSLEVSYIGTLTRTYTYSLTQDSSVSIVQTYYHAVDEINIKDTVAPLIDRDGYPPVERAIDTVCFLSFEPLPDTLLPKDMLSFLRGLKYPPYAKTRLVSGRVYVLVSVSEDGRIVGIEVMRGVDPCLDGYIKLSFMHLAESKLQMKPTYPSGKYMNNYFGFEAGDFLIPITFDLF